MCLTQPKNNNIKTPPPSQPLTTVLKNIQLSGRPKLLISQAKGCYRNPACQGLSLYFQFATCHIQIITRSEYLYTGIEFKNCERRWQVCQAMCFSGTLTALLVAWREEFSCWSPGHGGQAKLLRSMIMHLGNNNAHCDDMKFMTK